MSPSTTRNTELPKTALLFTLPVKEQANKMTTPIKINMPTIFTTKPLMRVYFNRL